MAPHWIDGLRQLNVGFWKVWMRQPIAATKLALLVVAVALRDFLLWIFMGERYLDDD